MSAENPEGAGPVIDGGVIYVAATPIGNTDDATGRLINAIETVDIVAAEDTRRFKRLCSRLGVHYNAKVVALHDHNESDKAEWLAEEAADGKTILVVSDAGTPTLSDPGYRTVQAAIENDVRVIPLPGPSAALAALSVSGLPSDRFVFEGFLPRKSSELHRRLVALAKETKTIILFESPRRTAATLRSLAEAFGEDRPAVICRELTKTHEEVIRGSLGELADRTERNELLGEVTLVIGGAPRAPQTLDYIELGKLVIRTARIHGLRLKEAAAKVAEAEGVRKNEAMQAALDVASHGRGLELYEG